MIEKGIGKIIHQFIFGPSNDECEELKKVWLTKCFQQPRIDQLSYTWVYHDAHKLDACKVMIEKLDKCKKNLKT